MKIKNLVASVVVVLGLTSFAGVLSCKSFTPVDTVDAGTGGATSTSDSSTSNVSSTTSTTTVTSTSVSTVGSGGSGGVAGVGGVGGVVENSNSVGQGGSGGSGGIDSSVVSTTSGASVVVEVCDAKCPKELPKQGDACDITLDQYCEYAEGACRTARCRPGTGVWDIQIMDPCVCYESPSSSQE